MGANDGPRVRTPSATLRREFAHSSAGRVVVHVRHDVLEWPVHGRPHRAVGLDRESARLLAGTGDLIVVPLDATVRLRAHNQDVKVLEREIPGFREQLDSWRKKNDDAPLVLHDVAALLVALGDRVPRMESRRLTIEPDGTMWASVDGPLQHVVAHMNDDATRARMRELASEGG